MKIIFLNIYQDLVNRGAETFVHEVAKRLSQDHQVIVVQGGFSKEPYQIKRIEGVINYPTDQPGLLWRFLHKFYLDPHNQQVYRFTKKATKYLGDQRPDWVIAVNGFWQMFQLKRLQKKQNFKILVSGQAGPGRDDYWNLKFRPSVFVALTNYAASWAETFTRKIKIVIIPNGVDLDKFSLGVKPTKIDLPRPIILCVGALVPYKKINLTIQAVAKLEKASLLILGQGPLEEELKKRAQEQLPGRFLITTVSADEIPTYYSAADLFTLASLPSEAFGIAYLEAMASGKAVVAPDDPAKREIVGSAGEFFRPDSLDDYVSALKQALAKDWGSGPRQQAEKFTWDEIAKDYEKVMAE